MNTSSTRLGLAAAAATVALAQLSVFTSGTAQADGCDAFRSTPSAYAFCESNRHAPSRGVELQPCVRS